MRVSSKKVNKALAKQLGTSFAQLVADTKTLEEADEFLKDFFTKTEYETFTKRLAIAYYLRNGRSYENIKTNIKVSSATISSVSDMMEEKGFKNALEKVGVDQWAEQWAEKIKKIIN